MPRLLVACECSGVVRDSFRAFGWDAVSCDIKPTQRPGPHHLGSVLDILSDGWDMMIAHPPCTYLTCTANRWLYEDASRWAKQKAGAEFFMRLVHAPINHICIENPVGCMSSLYRSSDQIICPTMFGHHEAKRTCLWLKHLPRLTSTNRVQAVYREYGTHGKRMAEWYSKGMGTNRAEGRSKTFFGVAFAMASQWSCLDI